MTFTKTLRIALVLSIQLVATAAFAQTSFEFGESFFGTRFRVSVPQDIEISSDGSGQHIEISYDAGPRVGTDEYLGRSVWAVVISNPPYDTEVLILSLAPQWEQPFVSYLLEELLPSIGGSAIGVMQHPLSPNALLLGQIDENSDPEWVQEATASHVLMVTMPTGDTDPAEAFDWTWNGSNLVQATYVADSTAILVGESLMTPIPWL